MRWPEAAVREGPGPHGAGVDYLDRPNDERTAGLNILGINAYHGDAAACLVQDGKLVAAAAEERFNRQKHCAGFPSQAILFCLDKAGLRPEDLDHIAISRDPSAHLHKKVLSVALNFFPRMMTVKDRLANVSRVRHVDEEFCKAVGTLRSAVRARFHNIEHHRAHLASAFYVSPFEEAAVLSIDGFGDFVSTMSGRGTGNQIEILDWIEYPHSLGLFYTATTQYLGFPKYGDEGKVMGLAPYGRPTCLDVFRDIVRLLPDGRFELNLDYFTHHSHGVEMSWDSGAPILGPVWSSAFVDALGPTRKPGDPIIARHQDIAASLQARLEEALLHVCEELHRRTSSDRICLAGGVALNCTFNGMIRERTAFKEVYIQPAAGDDGTAIGAAYAVHHEVNNSPRSFVMKSAYAGTEYSDNEIAAVLERRGIAFERCTDLTAAAREAARLMVEGQVVGWFQGAMEFGPRALGARSIVVDPRRHDMKDILNHRIKHREPFRPFAPSILRERVGEFFEQDYPSPFMLMAYRVREEKRDVIPAVTHVDGTGRLQTVDSEDNPVYWKLIKAFEAETGVPVILNTSFNENEPVVCTPDDALDCYLKTKMDALVMGALVIRKPLSERDFRTSSETAYAEEGTESLEPASVSSAAADPVRDEPAGVVTAASGAGPAAR
jgi:carbamoyltransferase